MSRSMHATYTAADRYERRAGRRRPKLSRSVALRLAIAEVL